MVKWYTIAISFIRTAFFKTCQDQKVWTTITSYLLHFVSQLGLRKKKKKRLPTTICSGEPFGLRLRKKEKKRLPTRICDGEPFRLRKKKGNSLQMFLNLIWIKFRSKWWFQEQTTKVRDSEEKQSFQKFKRTFHFAMVPVQSKYYKFLENISVYAWRRSRGIRERSGGGARYYNGWLYLYWLLSF